MLSEIRIKNLRNLTDELIMPGTGLNLIIGPNGSGKTSVLEAIHMLGLGRSFRSRSLKNAVQFDQQQLQVIAKTNQKMPIGLQFNINAGLEIRLNNAPLKKLSDLAAQLPLQLIPANSHQFFEQGPRFRRQLLDWGLFHVEPSFNFHWQSYKKVLQQRNSALRQNKTISEIQLWDAHLVLHGEEISKQRQKRLAIVLDNFRWFFIKLCPQYGKCEFSLKYRSGWAKDQTLAESIMLSIARDRQLGYTRSGTHAADWTFRIDNYDPADIFSRGQQKLFFLALCMAQVKAAMEIHSEGGILLIDDISSELDREHLEVVLHQLSLLPVQTFITSTDKELAGLISHSQENVPLFHVKQGQIITS